MRMEDAVKRGVRQLEELLNQTRQVPKPDTMYTSLSYLALLTDWLITLTLVSCDNIIL